MIEIEYLNGIKEQRDHVNGDEMQDPRIKEVLVFGNPRMRTHTSRLLGGM